MTAPPASERLIVALDPPRVPDAAAGRAIVARLDGAVSFYKIGLGLLTAGGLTLAEELKKEGKRVFLDMKLFDIPATVEAATRGLAALGPDFLTVHGDPHIVRAAVAGRDEAAMRILAVTVLTSLDRDDLDAAMILPGAPGAIALERARRAFEAGADGVIASPAEAAAIRALPAARGRLIVTPGVRPEGAAPADQKRMARPGRAVAAGADHIVVGRPIIAADDPAAAARAILAEIAAV